jgi:ankyrin repeat protein
LHYAAAYGNLFILKYLLEFIKQVQNKERLYPWDIAIGKGHLACAKYLRN